MGSGFCLVLIAIATAAAAFGGQDAENTEENEAVGGPEEVVRVFDIEDRGVQDESENPQQQKQCSQKPAGITEILNDPGQFHGNMV